MDAIFYRIVSHMINGAFQKHTTRPENTRNVVVFGSSGVGKTSLVNGLTGQNLEVGGGSRGVTFGCKHVPASYNGNDYDIIDTAGLNEAEGGTVAPFTAISSLVQLLSETKKGINLMIMVVSKGTITSTTLSNYNLFVNALTKNKIPLVFVVTHCERERGDMQGWVNENEHDIRERGISPREILATTFIIPDPEFDNVPLMTAKMRQSKELLWHAIHRWSTSQPINFQGERQEVVEIVRKCYNAIAGRIGCRLVWVTTKFVDLVQAVGNLSRADARNVAKRLEGKKKIERLPPPC